MAAADWKTAPEQQEREKRRNTDGRVASHRHASRASVVTAQAGAAVAAREHLWVDCACAFRAREAVTKKSKGLQQTINQKKKTRPAPSPYAAETTCTRLNVRRSLYKEMCTRTRGKERERDEDTRESRATFLVKPSTDCPIAASPAMICTMCLGAAAQQHAAHSASSATKTAPLCRICAGESAQGAMKRGIEWGR